MIRCVIGCGVLLLASGCHAGGLSAHITTPSGAAVESAVVTLEPTSGTSPLRHQIVSIKQQDREFLPYVTVVQAGAAVEFPNHDPIMHHVYSFSPPKVFEIKLYAGKPAQPILFDKPGVVVLGCNIHDWMEAYLVVVNTPYFAKTAGNGRAAVKGVPAGHYRLRLWHPRQKVESPEREVDISNGPFAVNLVLDVSPRVVKPKPPMDAETY